MGHERGNIFFASRIYELKTLRSSAFKKFLLPYPSQFHDAKTGAFTEQVNSLTTLVTIVNPAPPTKVMIDSG